MKKGFRRLYASLHKTDRKRAGRHDALATPSPSKPIPNWWRCTTIQPLEDLPNEPIAV